MTSGYTIPWKETFYAGIKMRSRLEARWAIFFDALELKWQYEPRTFRTPDGGYIPDFYIRARRPYWLEAKGKEPEERDYTRARAVETETRLKLRFLVGSIPEFSVNGTLPHTTVRVYSGGKWRPAVWKAGWNPARVEDALAIARSAHADENDVMVPGVGIGRVVGSRPF